MEYLFIYLLQLADMVDCICLFLMVIIAVLVFVACGVVGGSGYDLDDIFAENRSDGCEAVAKTLKTIKRAIVGCVVLAITVSFLPNKQTMLLMGGTYLGKKTIATVVDSGRFEKINTIIDLQLDKYIKELKEGNK